MKTVCPKNQCAGCKACVDICPTNSIEVHDSLAYLNAVINTETCINCNLCHRVCQVNNPALLYKPVKWLEGWAEAETRATSSSGGFGQELMRSFIGRGGSVAACKLINGDFEYTIVENEGDLASFIGSKYVKSNPIGIYKKINELLKSGRKVLFIGLPCQVSAVQNYVPESLKKKLYVVDLICHGSPSVRLLQKSLNEYGYDIKQVQSVLFRKNIHFGLEVSHKKVLPENVTDRYTLAFLRGLCYTENCYTCHYARTERVGDLTIGDSWGTKNQDELNKGISLILCQTEKGNELIKEMQFRFEEADINNAITSNQQLVHPSIIPEQRDAFFRNIRHGMGFNKAVGRAYPKDCFKQDVKLKLDKMGVLKSNAK